MRVERYCTPQFLPTIVPDSSTVVVPCSAIHVSSETIENVQGDLKGGEPPTSPIPVFPCSCRVHASEQSLKRRLCHLPCPSSTPHPPHTDSKRFAAVMKCRGFSFCAPCFLFSPVCPFQKPLSDYHGPVNESANLLKSIRVNQSFTVTKGNPTLCPKPNPNPTINLIAKIRG